MISYLSSWEFLRQYSFIAMEGVLLIPILLLVCWLGGRRKWPRPSGAPGTQVIVVFTVALVAHAAVVPFTGIQNAGVHDEFSYLLMSDTFASGRLSNPPHPLSIFFETFHVDQSPMYVSAYPPAQGIALAAGQILGHPMIGVWLGIAMFCASLCWMLQAWVPARWAFWGGLLAVLRFGLFSYWANSYWGGSVAALAGCLVWGSVGRLRKNPSPAQTFVLAAGLIMLANSRPYEGFISGVVALFALAGLSKQLKLLAPFAAAMLIGAGATGYYNWRAFGNPVRLPYQNNRATYSVVDSFLWQSVRPEPNYNHAVMKEFYTNFEKSGYTPLVENRTLLVFTKATIRKAEAIWLFFAGPALTIPFLIGAAHCLKNQKLRWPGIAVASVSAGLALLVWPVNPHYFAPATGCFFLLVMDGLRCLGAWHRQAIFSGKRIAASMLLACMVIIPIRASASLLGVSRINGIAPIPWYSPKLLFLDERVRTEQRLLEQGGRHLIVVRYAPWHNVHQEYVYNRADIDASKIVWARELPDPEANFPLLDYYKDRSIWLLRPDESRVLIPYPLEKQ
jgi:hypothetical protein